MKTERFEFLEKLKSVKDTKKSPEWPIWMPRSPYHPPSSGYESAEWKTIQSTGHVWILEFENGEKHSITTPFSLECKNGMLYIHYTDEVFNRLQGWFEKIDRYLTKQLKEIHYYQESKIKSKEFYLKTSINEDIKTMKNSCPNIEFVIKKHWDYVEIHCELSIKYVIGEPRLEEFDGEVWEVGGETYHISLSKDYLIDSEEKRLIKLISNDLHEKIRGFFRFLRENKKLKE